MARYGDWTSVHSVTKGVYRVGKMGCVYISRAWGIYEYLWGESKI
jgi:hypothetical protein